MRDWSDELTVEERDAWIEKVASGVVKRGLETPMVLFLEMHKPLSFVASQGLIVTSPFVAPFVGIDNVQMLSKLIEKRENIELLVQRIEELGQERRDAKKTPKPSDESPAG
jgi:hypothetical protein